MRNILTVCLTACLLHIGYAEAATIGVNETAMVQIVDHPTDPERCMVILSLDRTAAISPVLERALRERASKEVTRARAEDALLHQAQIIIDRARRSVQEAEGRALSGRTAEQDMADAKAKAEAEFIENKAAEPKSESIAEKIPELPPQVEPAPAPEEPGDKEAEVEAKK